VPAGTPVQKTREPWRKGYVLLDRRKPFELWLKMFGPIYDIHFQVGRLAITLESTLLRKRRDERRQSPWA
jgi:hypothetical protein